MCVIMYSKSRGIGNDVEVLMMASKFTAKRGKVWRVFIDVGCRNVGNDVKSTIMNLKIYCDKENSDNVLVMKS